MENGNVNKTITLFRCEPVTMAPRREELTRVGGGGCDCDDCFAISLFVSLATEIIILFSDCLFILESDEDDVFKINGSSSSNSACFDNVR